MQKASSLILCVQIKASLVASFVKKQLLPETPKNYSQSEQMVLTRWMINLTLVYIYTLQFARTDIQD